MEGVKYKELCNKNGICILKIIPMNNPEDSKFDQDNDMSDLHDLKEYIEEYPFAPKGKDTEGPEDSLRETPGDTVINIEDLPAWASGKTKEPDAMRISSLRFSEKKKRKSSIPKELRKNRSIDITDITIDGDITKEDK